MADTRKADITCLLGVQKANACLELHEGRWYVRGHKIASVRGCVYVDLAWTMSTNTLPIRWLTLGVGETSGPVTAAWIQFPELTIEPLPQQYTRLSDREYRYTSSSGFATTIEVDETGMVVEYHHGWQCERWNHARSHSLAN